MYRADPDAGPFDRSLMELARNLHKAGHEEEAVMVATAAAELREAPKSAPATTAELWDTLMQISLAGAAVCNVITNNFPDPFALKSGGT